MNLPKWINDEEYCYWCKEPMPIDTVEVINHWDFGPSVEVKFTCINDDCRCLKALSNPNVFKLLYYGSHVDLFETHQEKLAQKEVEPSQEEVPMAAGCSCK